MDRIYLFLIRNDVWIYIVSALALVWYVTEFIRAQRALRRAMFNLERETASRVRNHALSFILFFSALIAIVVYVNRNVAPELPAELLAPPTPTRDIFATPLASPTPLGTAVAPGNPNTVPVLAPTVTLPALPGFENVDAAGTPIAEESTPLAPEETPTPFVGCTTSLAITEPLDGGVAFQRVAFRGTADTGELHRYIIELNGPQTVGAWAPIAQEPLAQPVVNGDLGSADLSQWATGPYLARLRALDSADNEVGQCVIQFTLDN